jgi:hypothetical protein
MSATCIRGIAVAALLLSLCSSASFARRVPAWPYDKLLADSDLVAIVEPLENQPTQDTFPGFDYGHLRSDFVATNTRFTIHVLFKTTDTSPNELTVLHFNYSTNVHVKPNGASFVRFATGAVEYERRVIKDGRPTGDVAILHQEPLWLAFLRRREDGRFEAVTGQYDSARSFRELHRPSFFASP